MIDLPDFEDMQELIEEITRLSLQKSTLELLIKEGECDVFKRAQLESEFFQNSKPPSTSFIENAYKYTGLKGELIPLRSKLNKVTSALENAKMAFDLMKNKIEVWRSEQANNRTSVSV